MSSFISHKYRMIFSHIPRTGGTSFTAAMVYHLGEDDEVEAFPKHSPLRLFRIGRMEKYFNDYLKVSIWRNWQDRHDSLKIGALNAAPRIHEADRSEYWWDNFQWLCGSIDKRGRTNGGLLADVLISFDGLPGSAIRFLNRLGIYIEDYPHLNERGNR